jgi:hypothetical protein
MFASPVVCIGSVDGAVKDQQVINIYQHPQANPIAYFTLSRSFGVSVSRSWIVTDKLRQAMMETVEEMYCDATAQNVEG